MLLAGTCSAIWYHVMKELHSSKPPCGCDKQRINDVNAGRWECARVECPHRSHVVEFPDHGTNYLDGTYHVRPTTKDD